MSLAGMPAPASTLVPLTVSGPDGPRCWLLTGGQLRARARALSEPAASGPPAYQTVTATLHWSRSYREPYALVACWRDSVGVDIERVEPAQADFGASIATPTERLQLGAELAQPELVAALWSGKEALAKTLGDALRYDPRRLDSPLRWPAASGAAGDVGVLCAGQLRATRLELPAGHVGWLCWRA